MIEIGARQAWHDVFYVESINPLDSIAQKLTNQIGRGNGMKARQTQSGRHDRVQANAFVLARVKRTIAAMSDSVQLYGAVVYGPFCDQPLDAMRLALVDHFFELVCRGQRVSIKRWFIAQALILAAVDDQRAQAFGGESIFKGDERTKQIGRFQPRLGYSAAAVCRYCERFRVNLDHRNWHRDHQGVFNATKAICQAWDEKALMPVAATLSQFYRQHRHDADYKAAI